MRIFLNFFKHGLKGIVMRNKVKSPIKHFLSEVKLRTQPYQRLRKSCYKQPNFDSVFKENMRSYTKALKTNKS